jgi:hypothetical protein
MTVAAFAEAILRDREARATKPRIVVHECIACGRSFTGEGKFCHPRCEAWIARGEPSHDERIEADRRVGELDPLSRKGPRIPTHQRPSGSEKTQQNQWGRMGEKHLLARGSVIIVGPSHVIEAECFLGRSRSLASKDGIPSQAWKRASQSECA